MSDTDRSPAEHTIDLTPLGERFENAAGVIVNVLEQQCGGVGIIDCLPGSSRSHHRHEKDGHWLMVLEGEMRYVERTHGTAEIRRRVVKPWEMVFTGPGVEHSTYYPVKTRLLSMSLRPRTKAEHEADVVRCAPLPWEE